MAAIRDTKVTQLTVEAATITVELPEHATNDLLLVFGAKDAVANGAWTEIAAGGWTIGGYNNSTGASGFWAYKKATSSSETNPVFSQGDVDSIMAVAISIQGINTTTPINVSTGNGVTATSGQPSIDGVETTSSNCLVFYAVAADSGWGLTPYSGLQRIVSDDTGSTTLGVGWMFQATAGATGTRNFYGALAAGDDHTKFVVAVNDDGSATFIPPYHDIDTTMAEIVEPFTGTFYPFGGAWQTSLSIATIGSKSTAYDAITSVNDSGVNPFHASARITPALSKTNLGGTQFNFASAKDLTGGFLLGSTKFLTARDYIDTGFISNGGIQICLADSSNNYKSWMVGAQRSKTTSSDNRNFFAIQVDQSTDTGYATSVTPPTKTAIDKLLFVESSPLGIPAQDISQLVKINKAVIAGGSSTLPLSFTDLVSILNGYILPFAPIQGDGGILCYCPIQIGGSKAVAVDAENFSIQFPRQASQSTGYLDFHVDESVVGLIFDGRSGDVIKLRNGLIQSASKYKFEFLATVSTAATWDFTGLTVIGAIPTLRNIGTTGGFQSMSFIDCDQIAQNGATLNDVTINGTLHATAALLANDPSRIKNCSFISGGTKHAIEITAPGTYTFEGNTFTGFGANGTNSAAIFNDSGGAVTLNIYGGGKTPTVRNGAGASTTVNNSVTLEVNNPNSSFVGARVTIYANAGGPETEGTVLMLEEAINDAGVYRATQDYNFLGNQPVTVRAKLKGFIPFETTGTITSNGLTVTAIWQVDSIVV